MRHANTWCKTPWHTMMWHTIVWQGTSDGMIRHGLAWSGTRRHNIPWYDMTCCGMLWYYMLWNDQPCSESSHQTSRTASRRTSGPLMRIPRRRTHVRALQHPWSSTMPMRIACVPQVTYMHDDTLHLSNTCLHMTHASQTHQQHTLSCQTLWDVFLHLSRMCVQICMYAVYIHPWAITPMHRFIVRIHVCRYLSVHVSIHVSAHLCVHVWCGVRSTYFCIPVLLPVPPASHGPRKRQPSGTHFSGGSQPRVNADPLWKGFRAPSDLGATSPGDLRAPLMNVISYNIM